MNSSWVKVNMPYYRKDKFYCSWIVDFLLNIYLRNNSTVFEELEVSIVDLTVANDVLLAMRSGTNKTDICDRQIQFYCYSYSYEILPTCTH